MRITHSLISAFVAAASFAATASAELRISCTVDSVSALDYFSAPLYPGMQVRGASDHGHTSVRIGDAIAYYSENLDDLDWISEPGRTEISIFPRETPNDFIQIEINGGGGGTILVTTPEAMNALAATLDCK